MAERLENRAINQKVAGSIPGRGRNFPVLTVSRSAYNFRFITTF